MGSFDDIEYRGGRFSPPRRTMMIPVWGQQHTCSLTSLRYSGKDFDGTSKMFVHETPVYGSSMPGKDLGKTEANMRRTLLILLSITLIAVMIPTAAHGQQWSGVLAPSRGIDWSNAGVSGGIPTRTAICATLNPGASAAQINSAISSCPANQVVLLNAGTYNIAGIDFGGGKANVTLRGAGADKTMLVFSNNVSCNGAFSDVCMHSSDTNWKGGPSNLVNWTTGYGKGTTSITLASVPNLKVGFPIILDELDDASDTGNLYVCSSTSSSPPCSLEGNDGNAQRSGRDQLQIVTVTGCGGVTTVGASCSGSNVVVTISPGLYMPNWNASKSPQAWWATSPSIGVGIEDVSLDHTGTSGAGIEFFNCLNCWAKGVRDINTARAHAQMQYAAHITVRDSYFFLTQNSVSQSYGVECYTASDALVENNIFQAVASPEMMNGACSGEVAGYNFSVNNYYTGSSGYSLAATNSHSGGLDNVLYEGNVANQIYGDVFHGSHSFNTAFRNYWEGTQPACWISGSTYASSTFGACNNNLTPVVLSSYTRFYNFIGNVLGKTGVQNSYSAIFDLGGGDSEGSVTVQSDPLVATTLMRWGNYDTVNAAVRFVSSEVPSGLALYANPVPASQALPPSFYLSSIPTWWPSGKPWPAIGPDVTGGNIAGYAGHVYTIPAEDCYSNVMHGSPIGTDPVLSFNASTCYTNAPRPAPPTNVSILVQ